MRRKGNRNRVLDLRLWDSAGFEWARVGWLDAEEADQLLAAGAGLMVHGMERPMEWVPESERLTRWRAIRPYVLHRGERWGPSDASGRRYDVALWERDGHQLLGVQVGC